jgi:hypothetical protein
MQARRGVVALSGAHTVAVHWRWRPGALLQRTGLVGSAAGATEHVEQSASAMAIALRTVSGVHRV